MHMYTSLKFKLATTKYRNVLSYIVCECWLKSYHKKYINYKVYYITLISFQV